MAAVSNEHLKVILLAWFNVLLLFFLISLEMMICMLDTCVYRENKILTMLNIHPDIRDECHAATTRGSQER